MNTNTEVRGRWWLPESPNEKFYGNLILKKGISAELILDGSFSSVISYGEKNEQDSEISRYITIINGNGIDGHDYTLNECYLVSNLIPNKTSLSGQTFRINTIFKGHIFKEDEEIRFNRIIIHFDGFELWFSAPKLNMNLDKVDGNEIKSIMWVDPKEIDVNVNTSFSLSLYNSEKIRNSIENVKIKLSSMLSIKLSSKTKFEKIIKLISQLQQFFSFVMGIPTFATEIYGYIEKKSIQLQELEENTPFPIEIYTYSSITMVHSKEEKIYPYYVLFTYENVREAIPNVINNWLDFTEKFKPIPSLYFSNKFNSKEYIQHNFLNLCQCLEIYHRISDNYRDYSIDPNEYSDRIALVKKAIKECSNLNSKVRKSTISQLKFGNKPTLSERILSICNSYPDIYEIYISDFSEFSEIISDNRNFLTHHDKKEGKKYLTDEELRQYNLKLNAFIIVIILIEMGFKKKEIQQYIQNCILM